MAPNHATAGPSSKQRCRKEVKAESFPAVSFDPGAPCKGTPPASISSNASRAKPLGGPGGEGWAAAMARETNEASP